MGPQQRAFCRELLRRSIEDGFGTAYQTGPIARRLGISENALYNEDTETGLLYELVSDGYIGSTAKGEAMWIPWETHEVIEAWSREP